MTSFADIAKLIEEIRYLRARAARTLSRSELLRLDAEDAIRSLHKTFDQSRLFRREGQMNGLEHNDQV